jgi:putative spermidine/putrescine transport system substrate-binding protein
MKILNRVRVWCLALLVVLSPGLVLFTEIAHAQSNVVVFAGWGGTIERAQRQIFFDSFEKQTGIKVIDVPDVQLPKIKAMVDAGTVQWDVVQSLGMWIPEGAKENLWEPLDYNVIQKAGVPPALLSKYAIGNSTYGIGLAYNTQSMAAHEPTTWTNFWDVQGYPGPRGLFDGPRYTLEAALLADGVAPDKLYPLDVDRAFRALDRIKAQVHIWWKQWPQVPVLLNSRELAMSLTSNTRIATAHKEENAPLKMTWKGALMTVDFLAVPRGAKNRANAMKLIQWMNDPQRQAALARITGIGPGNANALNSLSDAEKNDLASYHYQKGEAILFNNEWWADNEAALTQRWNTWILK